MKPGNPDLPSSLDVNDERPAAQSTHRADWVSRALFLSAAALLCVVFARDIFSGAPDIVGKPAPPLVVIQLDGKPLSLADLAGHVILIDFWSISCGPCETQIPTLAAIETRFRNRAFRLLSLNAEPSEWPHAAKWLQQRVPGSRHGLADAATLRAYGADRLPRLVLVRTDGIVATAFTGLTAESTLMAAIERELPR